MTLDRKEASEYLLLRRKYGILGESMDTIQLLWQRIETWMRMHVPHAWQILLPGASETDIHQTEIGSMSSSV